MKYLIFIILIINLNLFSKEQYLECDKDETKIYVYDNKIIIHCSTNENKKIKKIQIKSNSEKDKKFFKELKESNFDFDIEFKKAKIKIIIKDNCHSDEEWLLAFLKEENEFNNAKTTNS